MPTPARLATAAIGAWGSSRNTARAASSICLSLRAASARLPLSGPVDSSMRFILILHRSSALSQLADDLRLAPHNGVSIPRHLVVVYHDFEWNVLFQYRPLALLIGTFRSDIIMERN